MPNSNDYLDCPVENTTEFNKMLIEILKRHEARIKILEAQIKILTKSKELTKESDEQ